MNQIEIARRSLDAKIEAMKKRFELDAEAGRRDAKAHVFDKWYRNNRSDGGEAYQAGWQDEYSANGEGPIQFIEG